MSIFGKKPKTDYAAIQRQQAAQQEAAAAKAEQEAAAKKAAGEQAAIKDMEDAESRRRAFAGALSTAGQDDPQRRKFLKAV